MKQEHKASVFKTRRFKSGGYAVLVSVVVVLVVVAVNVFAGQLPSSAVKFDTTAQGMFTFSEQTTQMVKNLQKNVTLTLIAEKGSENQTLVSLLDRYKGLSDKVTITTVDPVVQPKYTSQFTADEVAANSVIVQSGERSKVVANADIFQADYSNYYSTGNYSVNFAGESELTSAIDYVTSDTLPTIYQLQGHGETALAGTLKTAVDKDNLLVKEVSLLSMEAVPEDCSTLLIYASTADLGDEELQKILAYMDKGGHLLLITDYSSTAKPNLTKLIANYGLGTTDGIVVEGDMNHCVPNYQHYLLPTVNTHDITKPIQDGNYYILMPVAQGIVKQASYRSSLTITSLLTTSASAYNKSNPTNQTTLEREATDQSGPFDVGVAVSEKVTGGETRMVWYSTSQFLVDDVNNMVGGANQNLFLNSLNWMCERENNISIRARSMDSEQLTIPSATADFWSGLLAVVLPLSVLGAGIFVVVRRRKR